MRKLSELRRYAERQAYRPDGGCCFIQADGKRKIFCRADDAPAGEKQRQIQQQNGRSAFYNAAVDAAVKKLRRFLLSEYGMHVCRKHGKPVLVMEPVKGGSLVNLPEKAKKVLDDLHGGSPASYAIRFAAGFPGMMMVLSGMSNMEQMKDNLSYMRDFKPLNETELAAVKKVQEIFHKMNMIPCTACRYCVEGCPKQISIPDLFAIMNIKQLRHDWNADYYYEEVHTAPGRRASDCLKCGKCEKICPQHLPIRKLLEEVAKEFDKPEA